MKRKNITLFIILLLLSIALSAQSSKALSCELIYLQTDKSLYYTDESIHIEASWTFDYDEVDDPFFQIRMFDAFDNLIWNTSEYIEKGLIEKNWTVIIQYLNLNFTNFSNTVSIEAFVFNERNGAPMFSSILDTIIITINKRNICCELTNFKEKLIFGKNLSLTAHFYCENTNLNLSGKEITVYIISNNLKTYEGNFSLNSQGLISLNFSSINDMVLGINYLVFNLTKIQIYNQTWFSFQILVEKAGVYIEILKYKEEIGWIENVELELFFYYIDNSIIPIMNQTIEILIYDNFSMNYQFFSNTDAFGVLKINLSTQSYDINYINGEFYVDLIFNGSEFLKDKTLALKFKIATVKLPEGYSLISFIITAIVSILGILVIINYVYHFKKKKPKFKKINEICFKF
ncbi:MAG: hypothetical protein EU531_07410 [Promethearchaeota archaeon]|nr:MAG: hypothetical protein EU531_07410 [Candidatus Lokiarchaeota archaeon]